MSKNWNLKEIEPSYDQKINYSHNSGQNIEIKIEKVSNIGHKKKNLLSAFACFLTAIAYVWLFEGRLSTRLSLHPNLRFFKYFLISFGTSWGNSYTKFVIPDVKFRFTCGGFEPVQKHLIQSSKILWPRL